jgi:hypothetical protein
MRALNQLSKFLALGLVTLLVGIGPAAATVFEVQIDTSGASGDAVMAFDFNNSDEPPAHRLDIWDFASDGLLFVSATADPADCPPSLFPFDVSACKDPPVGSVTGTLGQNPPLTVTISDAVSSGVPTISYYQKIALPGSSSSYISFRFEMSGDPTTDGASPDGFAFWLLNPGDVQNPDGNPGGDLLLSGPLILYTFGGSCDTAVSAGAATCTEVRVPSVPEPAPVVLTIAALLALTCARWRAPAFHRRRAVRV